MSDSKLARVAGLLYVLSLPTTGFWFGVGGSLAVGDAVTMLANVQAHRLMLELALISGAIGAVNHLVLALLLQRLFKSTGPIAAALLLVFTVASVPLSLAAIARQMDLLTLADLVSGNDANQIPLQLLLTMRSYEHLFATSAIFWGVWLVPLGWLVWRCGFVPRVLGVLIWMGAPFYVLAFAGPILNPGYAQSTLGQIVGIGSGVPDVVGELGLALWLLVAGSRWRSSGVPVSRQVDKAVVS